MTISVDFRRAVNAPESDVVSILLLAITGDGLSAPIYLCTDPYENLPIAGVKGVVSNGVEYIYLPISFTLPSMDDKGSARATISIDNIDREIVAAARGATGVLNLNFKIVLHSDVDAVEIEVDNLRLVNVSFNARTVSGEISQRDYGKESWPSKRRTPSLYRGAF